MASLTVWARHQSTLWSGPSSTTTFFGAARSTFGFQTSRSEIRLRLAARDLILKDYRSFSGDDGV